MHITKHIQNPVGAGIAQWYSAGLRAGWSGVRVPAGGGNFSLHHRVQTCSGAHQAFYSMGNRSSFPGDKTAGVVKLTTYLHLVPRSRMGGAIPPITQYASIAWCSVKAQIKFYLFIHDQIIIAVSDYTLRADERGVSCKCCPWARLSPGKSPYTSLLFHQTTHPSLYLKLITF
jgi:hypothetical protein